MESIRFSFICILLYNLWTKIVVTMKDKAIDIHTLRAKGVIVIQVRGLRPGLAVTKVKGTVI
jgi:hypothetical protein